MIDASSDGIDFPEGWHPIEECTALFNGKITYGGIISSLNEAADAEKIYALVTREESTPNLHYYHNTSKGPARVELGAGYSEFIKTEIDNGFIEVLPETSFIIEFDINAMLYSEELSTDALLKLNKTYVITFNSKTYERQCLSGILPSNNGEVNVLYVGNPRLFGGADNGDPFLIICSEEDSTMGTFITWISYGTHTISIQERSIITTEQEVIHKIDPKYYNAGSTCEHEWVVEEALSALLSIEPCTSKIFKSCKKCGTTMVDRTFTHEYETVVTEPTCTEPGYTTYTCSVCGHSYNDYIEPLGHTLADDTGICEVCGAMPAEEYLTFTLLDNDTYEVTAKDVSSLPNEIVIPSIYNGKSVTSLGNAAFKKCYNLTSAVIPDSIISINKEAFYDCRNLQNVIIPDSVTSIGDYAFYDCERFTNIVIGDSVTSIGENAFCGCGRLTNITIGNNVTTIGKSAFFNCSSLVSILIPDSVTYIGPGIFVGCSKLTTIYCETASQPSGWVSNWNLDNRPVVWGYTG